MVSFGDATNFAPPQLHKYLPVGSYREIKLARLRRNQLPLDITTRAAAGSLSSCAALNWPIFCWLQYSHSRASLLSDSNWWAKSMNSLTTIIPTLSARVKIVNRN
jgi:hypothetical protein